METNFQSDKYKSIQRVLWVILFANLGITAIKITLGLATGVLAVVADGFHSLVDSSSNLIGLAAVRMARRPPDERYPYGYRRFETLGALAISGLLLVAAWEIIRAIIERISTSAQPEIGPLALIIMLGTFPVNLGVVIFETREGRRLNSEILLADAAHTRSDLYVTASVILSLIGMQFGWLWLDWLVAGFVVIFILRAAFEILRDAAGSLADIAGVDPLEIEQTARKVPGVIFVHRIRSRGAADTSFVDLHVKVDPGMSTAQAHAIASEVEHRLREDLQNVVDALVHIEPAKPDEVNPWSQLSFSMRQIAEGMGLVLHDLHIHLDEKAEYEIELHLELPNNVTLGAAHKMADDFEERVQRYWPKASSIYTHLEPLNESFIVPEEDSDLQIDRQIFDYLSNRVGEQSIIEVRSRLIDGHPSAAIRFSLPADLSLMEAHACAEEIERDLLAKIPRLYRVLVHVEPSEAPENLADKGAFGS